MGFNTIQITGIKKKFFILFHPKKRQKKTTTIQNENALIDINAFINENIIKECSNVIIIISRIRKGGNLGCRALLYMMILHVVHYVVIILHTHKSGENVKLQLYYFVPFVRTMRGWQWIEWDTSQKKLLLTKNKNNQRCLVVETQKTFFYILYVPRLMIQLFTSYPISQGGELL